MFTSSSALPLNAMGWAFRLASNLRTEGYESAAISVRADSWVLAVTGITKGK